MFINKKILIVGVVFLLILFLAWADNFPIHFWDNLFLTGLFCFMLGGTSLLLKKGVFNNILYSFHLFLRKTSKLEKYVSETNGVGAVSKTPTFFKLRFSYYLLATGVLLITVSTIFSIYLF